LKSIALFPFGRALPLYQQLEVYFTVYKDRLFTSPMKQGKPNTEESSESPRDNATPRKESNKEEQDK